MLSECKNCKYYSSKGCAVNPYYWRMRIKIRPQLNEDDVFAFSNFIVPCSNFEQVEEEKYANTKQLAKRRLEEVVSRILKLRIFPKPSEIILAGDCNWETSVEQSKIDILVLFPWWVGDSIDTRLARLGYCIDSCLATLPYGDRVSAVCETRRNIEVMIWCLGFENTDSFGWEYLKTGTVIFKRPWWWII